MTRVVIYNHLPARDQLPPCTSRSHRATRDRISQELIHDSVNWGALKFKLKGKVCDPDVRADAISSVVNLLLTKWTNNPHEKELVRELVRHLAYHCELTIDEAAKRVIVLLRMRRGPDSLVDTLDAMR